jgi:hypothetical protein
VFKSKHDRIYAVKLSTRESMIVKPCVLKRKKVEAIHLYEKFRSKKGYLKSSSYLPADMSE